MKTEEKGTSPHPQAEAETPCCLCVELGGTVVQPDTLVESLLAFIRARPLSILRVALWMCMGKARLKQKLGQAVSLEPDALPYSKPLLDYMQSEAKRGRRLVLVTGADASIANSVAK